MSWMFTPDETSVLSEIIVELSLMNRDDLMTRFVKVIANINEDRNNLERMMSEGGHGQ